jgi:sugar/nucleoside kinase (ribokinase family)
VETHLNQILPLTDVFLTNDDEGELLTGESDPLAQTKQILSFGCPNVMITMGERGGLAVSAKQTLKTQAFQIDVVDHSGSGDTFDSGCNFGLLQGWDMHRTLVFACALGCRV